MNILFVGLGSIAKRHIKNLKFIDNKMDVSIIRSGIGNMPGDDISDLISFIWTSFEDIDKVYDAIFITNPTFLHYDSLKKYNEYSDNFFLEKPVFLTGDEDITPFTATNKTYYVACPLRYSNVIRWLKSNVDFSKVHAMRVISSSYLPDWRLGIDYRDTYSAHKEMGGGVSIDLIHEWDYINYLIGFPVSVESLIRKKSNLEIDTDDIAVYVAEYPDKLVEIHLDYFGRKSIRRIEMFTEDDTIVADLIEQKIQWLRSEKVLDLSEDRDSYQKKELQHFLDIVEGRVDSDNDIEEACKVLRIARGVK